MQAKPEVMAWGNMTGIRVSGQLTADYSVLTGGRIFGTQGPLTPTQRFWNLKQLASTPENAFSIPVACNKEGINCAAFANISRGEYAVHIGNNGAESQVVVKGIPSDVRALEIFVTDKTLKMQKPERSESSKEMQNLNFTLQDSLPSQERTNRVNIQFS